MLAWGECSYRRQDSVCRYTTSVEGLLLREEEEEEEQEGEEEWEEEEEEEEEEEVEEEVEVEEKEDNIQRWSSACSQYPPCLCVRTRCRASPRRRRGSRGCRSTTGAQRWRTPRSRAFKVISLAGQS